jgi:hypothetical protein
VLVLVPRALQIEGTTQIGPISYAKRINEASGTFVALNTPPGLAPWLELKEPETFRLMEATSNEDFGDGVCDWPARCGVAMQMESSAPIPA